jgi:hypothetical protein
VFGIDAFIVQNQGESFENATKHLKYNIELSSTLKELQVKADYAKQQFLKAEKAFL